jgi:hypothetical protein
MKKKILGFGLFGIPILGVVLYQGVYQSFTRDSTEVIRKAPSRAFEQKQSISRSILRYGVERKLRSSLTDKNQKKTVIDLDYHGEIRLDPVPGSDGDFRYRFSFRLNFEDPGQKSSRLHESSHPVEVRFSRDFDLISLQADNSQSPESLDELNLIRDLVSILAFRSSQDTTGNYETGWSGSDRQLLKRKVRYVSPGLFHIRILSSLHEIKIREDGLPVSIVGGERMQLPVSKGVDLETDSGFRLLLLEGNSRGPAALSLKEGLGLRNVGLALDAVSPSSGEEQFRTRDAKDLEEMLSMLPETKPPARMGLFHQMVEVLRREPKLLPGFIQMVWEPRTSVSDLESEFLRTSTRTLRRVRF